MDQNMYNYHGMNSRGGHDDRYAEQMQMQAQTRRLVFRPEMMHGADL